MLGGRSEDAERARFHARDPVNEPAVSLPSRIAGAVARAWFVVAPPLLLAVLALPLLALLLRVQPQALIAGLGDPAVLEALRLSLITSAIATLLVVAFGLPLAYLLAMRPPRFARVIDVLVDLPMVLPPTVAGFALLMAFGRAGLLGRVLRLGGIELPFTTAGVVLAQVFMAAPFFIAPVRAGFAAVDRRYLDAAATLRASETYRVVHVLIPLSRRSILAGIAMAAARALGEFGATITFAGNLGGVTRTMPLAVYVEMQSDLQRALVLSVLMLAMALVLLAGLRSAPGVLPRAIDRLR